MPQFFILLSWKLLNNVNLFYSYSGPAKTLRQSLLEGKLAVTEEEMERKALMSVVPKKRAATIQKLIEDSKEPKPY
jgi:hypothetical protein